MEAGPMPFSVIIGYGNKNKTNKETDVNYSDVDFISVGLGANL